MKTGLGRKEQGRRGGMEGEQGMGMGRQEGESLGKSLLVFNREDVVNTVGSQVERRGKPF